jgi:large-conductance mechanosensitive channel
VRILGGAILFAGAVGLLALTAFRSRSPLPNPDTEYGLFALSLVAYVIGAFALFLVVSGALAEHKAPPWDRH